MPGYALRFRLLPIAAVLCVGSCLSTEGYYRYQDGGTPGSAGTSGTTGEAGTTGNGGSAAGTSGSAGTGGSAIGTAGRGGTTGTAGTTGSAGRGGTTRSAGRGGTTGSAGPTGSAGRGGTTGSAGTTGGGVLFMDDFESGTSKWDLALNLTHSLVNDGSQALDMSEIAGDQALAAAPLTQPNWTNISVEARVKV